MDPLNGAFIIKDKATAKLMKMKSSIGQDSPKMVLFAERQINNQIGRIIRRMVRGVDLNEKEFKPYIKSYAGFRESKGRRGHPPDLIFTGKYYKSFGFQVVNPSRYKIAPGFGGFAEDLVKRGRGLQRKRKHFGWSQSDRKTIYAAWKKFLNDTQKELF